MPVTKRRSQQGFTMIPTVLGMSAIAMIALVAVTAVNGDLHLTQNDLAHKRAYEAAKAGIDDYAYHLRANGNYWGLCTEVPEPNAVNQLGKTEKRRPVPGKSTGAEYALELIPASGHSICETDHPTTSMIETSGQMKGTFRIRSNGFAEKTKVSITATFKTASFLDYVYFTQLETLDPVTFGFTEGTPELKGANEQCSKTRQEGRYSQSIPNTNPAVNCVEIVFKDGDMINGPLHTNDAMAICDKPTFGRNSLDVVEVSALEVGSLKGWYNGSGCTGNPNFKGNYITGAVPLFPPATNSQLKEIAEEQFRFGGQVHICLSGTSMIVAADRKCEKEIRYSGSIPPNGLVYVYTEKECPASYSPFTAAYPAASGCGTAYVHGTYTGQLTIAAENDIVIDGSTCRGACAAATGNGMLGLIANNFIRVFHNYPNETLDATTHQPKCNSGSGEETVKDITIDAALLSINHSFIVDHYDCGSNLGTLTVRGAISQKFRGPVGKGSVGYTKSYNYDDRLKYLEPPSFIEPEKLPWVIGRETLG